MTLLNIFNRLYDTEILCKLGFLKNIRLFEGIKKRQLIHVLESLQERTYLKGETIFAQGDIGRALFIVFSGKIALARVDPATQKNEVIAEVHPGEFFGEMALLEEMPRTATAYALEDTKVFMLFKIKLESLLFARPAIGVTIAAQLAKIMSARLRAMMEKPGESR
jgi:CRP-like cAMP-binding protein